MVHPGTDPVLATRLVHDIYHAAARYPLSRPCPSGKWCRWGSGQFFDSLGQNARQTCHGGVYVGDGFGNQSMKLDKTDTLSPNWPEQEAAVDAAGGEHANEHLPDVLIADGTTASEILFLRFAQPLLQVFALGEAEANVLVLDEIANLLLEIAGPSLEDENRGALPDHAEQHRHVRKDQPGLVHLMKMDRRVDIGMATL